MSFAQLKYLHLSILLLLFTFVKAQHNNTSTATVKGRVKDSGSQNIAFASIKIDGTELIAQTNDRGEFVLKSVPYGHHEVVVSSVEIEPKRVKLHVHQAHHHLDIHVKKAELDLNEVRVVQKTEKRELETKGFAVNIIDTKEVAMRNITTNELLDRSAGIRVRQNGGLGSSVNYNLNGMSGGSVRIFIDGIPISTYGSSFSLNSIPPSNIERIEVYKGVIPAHLADDALGGAINVILKKDSRNNLSASVSYGSFNTLQSSLTGMYRAPKSGFTAKGSAFHNYSDNDYEVWGKFVRNILPNGRYEYVRAKRFNDAYRSTGGMFELGFTDVKWADQFFVGFNASNDYNEIQHGTYMSIPYKGRFTKSNAQVFNLNYRKKNFLVKGLEATFSAMRSQRKQVVNDTVKWNYNWFGELSLGLNGEPILRPQGAQQAAPTINHIKRNVTTARGGFNYDLNDNHRFVFNHIFNMLDRNQQDFMRSEIERTFIGTRDLTKNISSFAYELKAFDSKLRTNLFYKYYQQSIERMDPVLTTENGSPSRREDIANNKKTAKGYGAAISYAIKSNLYILTSAEKAVRLPSEDEIFGSPGENIVENFGIRPEVSNNLNLGFRAGPFNIEQHKFSVGLTGFVRDSRDKIVRRVNPRLNDAVQTDPFENLGKTKAIGFEAEANYTLKNNLNIGFNLSKFNSVFNQRYDANGREFDHYNKQLPNEPFFTFNANAQYRLQNIVQKGSALHLHYRFGFVERFYTTWLDIEDFRTPRQYIQDIGASYTFPDKKFIVSLDFKNIFNQQAYDNFAVQKPGRSIFLKLNYSIHNF